MGQMSDAVLILHECGTIIAATAAVIAAISSLVNGKRIQNGHKIVKKVALQAALDKSKARTGHSEKSSH
jgi:hypothetical protein